MNLSVERETIEGDPTPDGWKTFTTGRETYRVSGFRVPRLIWRLLIRLKVA